MKEKEKDEGRRKSGESMRERERKNYQLLSLYTEPGPLPFLVCRSVISWPWIHGGISYNT